LNEFSIARANSTKKMNEAKQMLVAGASIAVRRGFSIQFDA